MLYLEYSLEEQEFQEFVYYANWLSPEQKDYRFNYYFFNSFSYIIFVLLFAFAERRDFKPLIFLPIFVVAGIFIFFYLKRRSKSYPYQVAQQLISKEGGSETILSRRELTLKETDISIKTNLSELKYSWSGIIKKIEHKNCFYLYVGPRDAIIIPKRIFNNKNDYEKFEEYLSRYLSLSADLYKHSSL